MPPGGPSSYGGGHEDARQKRFNFPSKPSRHVAAQAGDEPRASSAQPPTPPPMPSNPPTPPTPQQQPQQPQQPPPQRQQQPPQPQHEPPRPQHQPPQPKRSPRHAQSPQHAQPPQYDDGRFARHRDEQSEPRQFDQGPPPSIQPVQPAPRSDKSGQGSRIEQQPLVRPYAMTGGRTRPRYQLAIEALVHTSAEPGKLQGQLPEHQRICRLCYEIKSVAEISALLTIPLGVARILVADLAEAGLVAIHQPGGDGTNDDGQPDVTLLERVLSGLRKL
jgi:hypothetical protein